MLNNLCAEHLKTRRTFLRKLIWIAPLIPLFHALLMIPFYFISDAYNWWYIVMLPAAAALVPALMNRYESRKLHYGAVLSLPVSLRKAWHAKVALASAYVLCACAIHLMGVLAGKLLLHTEQTTAFSCLTLITASAVLLLTTLWQIPLCLFLAKRFGMLAAAGINTVGGILLGVMTSTAHFWWLCPYSYGARLMIPILGILPNGLMAESGNPLLAADVIFPGIVAALLLFVLLSLLTASRFSVQEMTK